MKILDLFKKVAPNKKSNAWADSEMRPQAETIAKFTEAAQAELSSRFNRQVSVTHTDHFDDHDYYAVEVVARENDDIDLMKRILRKPILLVFEKLGTENSIEDLNIVGNTLDFFVLARFKK